MARPLALTIPAQFASGANIALWQIKTIRMATNYPLHLRSCRLQCKAFNCFHDWRRGRVALMHHWIVRSIFELPIGSRHARIFHNAIASKMHHPFAQRTIPIRNV